MLHRSGKISPFSHRTESGAEVDKHLEIGDGIFFQGSRTYHRVRPQDDADAVRYIAGWQYTDDPTFTEPKSLCSEFRGATLGQIVSILLPIVISSILFHYVLCLAMVGTEWTLNNSELTALTVLTAGFAAVFPAKLPVGTGTHVNCSPDMAIAFFACCCFCTFDLRIAMLLFDYTLVSEAFLPTKHVRWD